MSCRIGFVLLQLCPRHPQVPPSWDLDVVLRHVMSEAYEPLESLSLRSLTKKALFLVAFATAKGVGELQALSRIVSSVGSDLVVSYLPHFVVKTERADAPLPRSFHVLTFCDFAGDLENGSFLCPVRALRVYLERTRSAVARASSLFVSPRSPSWPILKNAVSYFLTEVISDVGAIRRRWRPSPESSQHSLCFHFCCVSAKLVGL